MRSASMRNEIVKDKIKNVLLNNDIKYKRLIREDRIEDIDSNIDGKHIKFFKLSSPGLKKKLKTKVVDQINHEINTHGVEVFVVRPNWNYSIKVRRKNEQSFG